MKENKKIKLNEISKELPFKVPENYFDNFYSNLQAKIALEPISKPQRKILHFNFRPYMAYAATFLLAAILFVKPWTFIKSSNNTETVEQILYSDLDDYSIYSMLSGNYDENKMSLTDKELEDYIDSNSSDYEIYLELNK